MSQSLHSEDKDLESFLTTSSKQKAAGKKRPKRQHKNPTEVTLEHKLSEFQTLDAKTQDIVKDMMVQCRLNQTRFDMYLQKKKRKEEISREVGMINQEVQLMHKQLEKKERMAREFEMFRELAEDMNCERVKRKKVKELFLKETKESNEQKVQLGKQLKNESIKNKQNHIFKIFAKNRKSYQEEKSRETIGKKLTAEFRGTDALQHQLKVVSVKVNHELEKYSRRKHTNSKLKVLDGNIREKLVKQDSDIEGLEKRLATLVDSQKALKEQLSKATINFEKSQTSLVKLNKLNEWQQNICKRPTLTCEFSDFKSKAERVGYLFSEEKRSRRAGTLEEESVRKEILDQMSRRDTLPALDKFSSPRTTTMSSRLHLSPRY
jgi:hypothetical protein